MDKSNIILILVSSISIVCIYLWINRKDSEPFTALSGFNPLTSYDDFATFNFMLNTDDLPYYDRGFKGMFCGKPDYNPADKSYINYEGFKVRRKLTPSNYTDNMDLGKVTNGLRLTSAEVEPIADLNRGGTDDVRRVSNFIVRKDRPRASLNPPMAYNYYF